MPDLIDENGAFTEDFRSSLPDLLGDDLYNDPETKLQPTKELDNVKTLSDMARRVVNGSRVISKHGEELKKATEGMVKIPGEGSTPEEIVAYRKSIGVPETADGYELTVPDGQGYDIIAKEVKAAAHEAGIPPSKLSTVWDKVVTNLKAQNEVLEKKGTELLEADKQALKDLMKDKYDSFISDTDKVAAHFNAKEDVEAGTKADPIGDDFMHLMDTLGVKDVPVVRRFLGAIAPLVLEGKTGPGGGGPKDSESTGGFSYEYDKHGKPI